jgi:2-iminoacetate synthase ThiH
MVPPRRLDLIQTLGQLRIPTTIRLLVGLGECEASRIQTLAALGEIHAKRGHLQAVQIAPFRPMAGTPLETQRAADPDLIVRTVRRAAELLKPLPIQVPALEVEDCLERCIDAGAEDLGLITINPDHEIEPAIAQWEVLERRLIDVGHRSLERLVLTESSVARGLYPPGMAPTISHQLERLESRLTRRMVAPMPEVVADESAGAAEASA